MAVLPTPLFWNVVLNLWEVVVYEGGRTWWFYCVCLFVVVVCYLRIKLLRNTDEGSDPENKLGDVFILFSV